MSEECADEGDRERKRGKKPPNAKSALISLLWAVFHSQNQE